MYKYDVSIIVAVYNNEKYVEECIKSVIQQEFDFSKIQLILIDDGSKDNSATICENYAKQYQNILFMKHDNHGVSYTRNIGIQKAEGKYIMILDSDDFISNETVKELFHFMEENSEIDISSYTMKNYKEGKKSNHYRNKLYMFGTGVYPIEEFPHLSQATINIIFRNQGKDNVLYDEKMTLAEDEKFNTAIIMKKGKIGFCKEAIYYYRKHGESVSSTKQNPYYCFEQFTGYFEYLIEEYTNQEGVLPKYIQGLILQGIKWRINSDLLFPYYLEQEDYQKAIEKIKKILSHIEIDTILEKTNMNIFLKMYLLRLRETPLELKIGYGANFSINHKDKIVYTDSKVDLVFNRFKIKNHQIYMLGYIRSPLCEFVRPQLYIQMNGKPKEQIIVSNSNMDYYGANFKTNTFYKFEYTLPLENLQNFNFLLKVEEHEIPLEALFSDWCAFNTKLERNRILIENEKFLLKYEPETAFFTMKELDLEGRKKAKRKLRRLYDDYNSMINVYRKFTKTNKTIWLYCDRNKVIDNAYYQFKHDIQKDDGIQRYYILDGDKAQYKKYFTPKEWRKYIIQKNSYKHKIMFLRCDKIITTFASINEYSPFKKKTISWYKDLLQYDLIYLQHGVLYAKLLKMYSKEFTEIDKIVVSSHFEEKNMIENYQYDEKDLIKTGMPRFDLENPEPNRKNKILFAPSWRAYLIQDPPVNGKRALKKNDFLHSKFYQEINQFLNNQKLDKLLGEKGIELHFKLHPIFGGYKDLFKIQTENIKLAEENVKNEEYNLFITDFSSFQFDFALLKTPMIYFVPDLIEFKAGLHTYRELDLPLEEAFGDIVETAETLIEKVKSYIEKDFQLEEKYKERMEGFFYKTENCCEKIYKELMKEER